MRTEAARFAGRRHPRAAAVRTSTYRPAAALIILTILSLTACQTLAPGADPVVVHTQQFQTLTGGAYQSIMAWWRLPGVAERQSPSTNRALDKLRTGFPQAYRSVDSALDRYKASKEAGIRKEMAALAALFGELSSQLLEAGVTKPIVIPEGVP